MRSPREAERRLCRPEEELTGRQSSIRYSGAAPTIQCRTRRAILNWMRFPIGSQWSSLQMAAETLSNLGTPKISLAAEFRTDWSRLFGCIHYIYIMYTAKNKKGHINVSLIWLSRSAVMGWIILVCLWSLILRKLESTPRSSLYHVYNHAELKRSYKKVSLTLTLRSTFKVRWLVIMRALHNCQCSVNSLTWKFL